MGLEIHRPYPGVALLSLGDASVLLGAPADAFKATKKLCNDNKLPFPRVLIAPQALLVEASPQFNPEFFLYDFLFVYGAAFKPDLADERLELVLDPGQVSSAKDALWITLNGPSRDDLAGYKDAEGRTIMSRSDVDLLANVSEHMAIKKGDRPRQLDEMITTTTFDRGGEASVLKGRIRVRRDGPSAFIVDAEGKSERVDLSIEPPVIPFALLPRPTAPNMPLTFGVKPLGTRSGFDLSGPTTGFLLWVNGRGVIYDGPVGTRYLLESQGISPEDIEVVVLGHCHEDHMGAFVELFLAGYRPRIYTAEPIYRSALVKLSSYFQKPVEEVARYLDYYRVTPGDSVDILGAKFDFFYTVHAIPTVGIAVEMQNGGGAKHRVQISGDTMHHEGLDKMRTAGVLTEEYHRRMRELIPDKKVDGGLYFADVGEAIIHGHPKDWAQNPNNVIYYHCPDNDHTRSFGRPVASPGEVHTLIEPRRLHPATPARLLSALRFLDIREPGWVASLLHVGRSRQVAADEVLASPAVSTPKSNSVFTVIVSGTATVTGRDGKAFTTLRPGEFFGLIELVDAQGQFTATVKADTPMELFDIDGGVFFEYVERQKLKTLIDHIWAQRPGVESAKIFRTLDLAVRNRVARMAQPENFKKGETIIKHGSKGDDFYVLVDGEVEISSKGKSVARLSSTAPDNFFGEISAVHPNKTRSADIKAVTDCQTLRISGGELRELFEDHMGVRYALMVAIEQRGG